MSIREEIHEGDVGTELGVKFYKPDTEEPIDISEAGVIQIKLQKPSGTTLEKTGTFDEDEEDNNRAYYVTQAGDLVGHGHWKIQGYVELSSGKWHSTVESFEVHKNL